MSLTLNYSYVLTVPALLHSPEPDSKYNILRIIQDIKKKKFFPAAFSIFGSGANRVVNIQSVSAVTLGHVGWGVSVARVAPCCHYSAELFREYAFQLNIISTK